MYMFVNSINVLLEKICSNMTLYYCQLYTYIYVYCACKYIEYIHCYLIRYTDHYTLMMRRQVYAINSSTQSAFH